MARSKRSTARLSYDDYREAMVLVPDLPLEALETKLAVEKLNVDLSKPAVPRVEPAKLTSEVINEALGEYVIAHLNELPWAGEGASMLTAQYLSEVNNSFRSTRSGITQALARVPSEALPVCLWR